MLTRRFDHALKSLVCGLQPGGKAAMRTLLDHPLALYLLSFGFLFLATHIGSRLQLRSGPLDEERAGDFDLVVGATLTLLSLIVAFSFSMAASRYDQRKGYEEQEANAIGTAYSRAALLPAADAAKVQGLLRDYVALRIRFYTTKGKSQLSALARAREQSQAQLWDAVTLAAANAPTPITALSVASMNDAINAQGYSQAAAWNRIPVGAWVLLYVLGGIATAMIGYRFRSSTGQHRLKPIIPAVVATAFFLIADIDCPKGGVIRVLPENLLALSANLH